MVNDPQAVEGPGDDRMKILLTALLALSALAAPLGWAMTNGPEAAPAPGSSDLPAAAPASGPSDAAPAEGTAGAAGSAGAGSEGGTTSDDARVETFSGKQTLGLYATAPDPKCPLNCWFGYGLFGTDGPEFEVGEGATRIVVTTTWTPNLPAANRLDVRLYREDAECGKGCFIGIGHGAGVSRVVFEADEVAAGTHLLDATPSTPLGVAVQQDVWFEVEVHYS